MKDIRWLLHSAVGYRGEHLGSYTSIIVDNEWRILKSPCVTSKSLVVHTDCFNHFISKWQKYPVQSARVNRRTVTCVYCKTKSSREIMNKLKFILGAS